MVLQEVTVPNLLVADFYADRSELTGTMKQWMDKHLNSKVLGVENCERRIWMGHWETFAEMPDISNHRDANFYEGAEAYAFLLRYMSGLVNPNGLDRPANDRFYLATARMLNGNPREYKTYHDIVTKLQRDTGFIMSNICDNVKPIRPWLIARELSAQARGSHILVIGELDESGTKISDVMQRMIVTANGYPEEMPDKITCLTIDDEDDNITSNKLRNLQDQNKLRIPTTSVINTENLSRAIELADVVYVTVPIGKDAEFDFILRNIWKNRINPEVIMLHTDIRHTDHDDRFARGLSDYIPASEIKRIHNLRAATYEAQRAQAEGIAAEFGDRRLMGLSPIREMERFPRPAVRLTA